MLSNKNALLRYKTIDNCLRNHCRRWTLDDLMEACSNALCEFEGIDGGVSKRTLQLDLQMMRSDKMGYNAPIKVYDNKYYCYEDEDYSITRLPMSEHDVGLLGEAVQLLRQFEDFDYFAELSDVVARLQDALAMHRGRKTPIVDYERKPDLQSLKYLGALCNHIVNRQTLEVSYLPFQQKEPVVHRVFPYLLKEFDRQWFLLCADERHEKIHALALDRILKLRKAENIPYREVKGFSAQDYFKDIVGVTRPEEGRAEEICFWASPEAASCICAKPLHASQTILEEGKDGAARFQLKLIPNDELYARLLSFGALVRVESPQSVVNRMKSELLKAAENYVKKG